MSTILFGQETPDVNTLLAKWHRSDSATREWLLIFGAIALVTLLALGWAIFVRKRRRRRHSHHHASEHSSPPAETPMAANDEDAQFPLEKKHRRRRRSGRKHRRRNPTLAETGGLPPIRPEGPPEA